MSDSQPPIKSPNSRSRKGAPKNCDECGRRFRPWVTGGKFCSVQCRSTSWSRRLQSLRNPRPEPLVSPERARAIQDEARAALDNLRKQLDA